MVKRFQAVPISDFAKNMGSRVDCFPSRAKTSLVSLFF
jgi:hypothetical protein